MNIRSSHCVRAALLVGRGVWRCAAATPFATRRAWTKQPPDEFAVLTKAPLVVPPDYNLRPPKPGAAPTNQTDPTDSAQSALFGSDPATVAASMPGQFQPGREDAAGQCRRRQRRSEHPPGTGVRPQEHDGRRRQLSPTRFSSGRGRRPIPARPSTPTPKPGASMRRRPARRRPLRPRSRRPSQQEKSGWFDGWFDWF